MDVYEAMLLKIYEASNKGDITMEETDELLSVVQEKKTREEYRKRRFMKDYKFEPDSPGADTGYITVDGKRIRVDMKKSNYYDGPAGTMIRQTAMDNSTKDSTLIVGREHFKVKGRQARDAVIQHEMGHAKYHTPHADSDTLDKEMMNKQAIINFLDSCFEQNISAFGITPNSPEYKDTRKQYMHQVQDVIKKYADKMPKNDATKSKLRGEAMAILKKYAKGGHTNVSEFEADRHAANKSGASNLKRGVRRTIKQTEKHFSKAQHADEYGGGRIVEDEQLKKMKADNEKDLQTRSKALKDKDTKTKYGKLYEDCQEIALKAYENYADGNITKEELTTIIESVDERWNAIYEEMLCVMRYSIEEGKSNG